MIATLFLMMFMMIVPSKFRKTGIKMIIAEKRQGLFLLILSKLLWWFMFLEIVKLWLPNEHHLYAYGITVVLLVINLVKEKKYIVFKRVKNQAV